MEKPKTIYRYVIARKIRIASGEDKQYVLQYGSYNDNQLEWKTSLEDTILHKSKERVLAILAKHTVYINADIMLILQMKVEIDKVEIYTQQQSYKLSEIPPKELLF